MFLDLSKAFDTVNHKILIEKLYKYGIRSNAHDWLISYLSNRNQLVEVSGHKSEPLKITSGVPQGSVLGPILFLIYMNDIANSSRLVKFLLFADDTTVYQSDKSLENLINTMNNECDKLAKWLAINRLTLNTKKTKYILFSSSHKLNKLRNTTLATIQINNSPIEKCEFFKFLGVYLQDNMKWNKHACFVSSKLAKTAAVISRLKTFLPSNVLLQIYNSLFLPHINYCLGVWGNTEKYNSNKIVILQKRVVRSIGNASYLAHTDPLFTRFNILKLEELFKVNVCKFMYKLLYGLLPQHVENYFNIQKRIHGHDTRHVNNLVIAKYKTELYGKTIKIIGPKLWNSLPDEVKSSKSFQGFKRKLIKSLKNND